MTGKACHWKMKTQLGRRKISTREDGGFWSYGYNARGEVSSASRSFSDQTAMPLKQFSYAYDDIGNRLTAAAGGRRETHSINSLNQVTSRTHNGRLVVTGEADPASNVVVEAQDARRAQRKGPLFWTELNLPLSMGGVYQPINIWSAKPNAGTGGADLIGKKTGVRFISPSPESLTYDADGNLTGDARWSYGWDAENRLVWMEEHVNPTLAGSGLQRQRLEFEYDALGRRISKKVRAWNEGTSAWVFQRRILMVWDGWNLLAELESATETGVAVVRRSYVWGLDLASSRTATGGVGALLFAREHNTTGTLIATYAPCYDGNGNVMALMNVQTSAITARYDYDAFGNLLRSTGPKATWNPFRFSTKYEDRESGLLYYGFRYYSPELGRWLSLDPIAENGGVNLYSFAVNSAVNHVDGLGAVALETTAATLGWAALGQQFQAASVASAELGPLALLVAANIVLWSNPDLVSSLSRPITEALGPAPLTGEEEGIFDGIVNFSVDYLRKLEREAERVKAGGRCLKCTYTWKPHMIRMNSKTGYGFPWSLWQVRKAGAFELTVTTPAGIPVGFDGGEPMLSPNPSVAIEAKLGYTWMAEPKSKWTTPKWGAFGHAFVQLQAQNLAAYICGLKYEVRLSNEDARIGFKRHIPVAPDPYRVAGW